MKTDCVGLVLNYRDVVRTKRCVANLLEEGIASVLIWDNSEDGGRCESELLELFKSMPQVYVKSSEHNLGFAGGVNAALQVIQGSQPGAPILLINNDALLLPGALAQLLVPLAEEPEVRIVFPSIDHGGWIRGKTYYHPIAALITDARLPGAFLFASGCCLLLRTPSIVTPLFDEDFFMYGEDVELGARLVRKLNALHHVDRVLVWHEGSASSKAGSAFYETHVVQAHLLLAHKLASGAVHRHILLLARLIVLPLRAIVRCVRQRRLTPLQVLISAWRGARDKL